jgi:hypothetical protein
VFAPSGPMTQEQAIAYGMSDQVAPRRPHRSRITLPLPESDLQLNALVVHELTHLLVSEIILPGRGGDGGVPRWVQEGIATYMVGVWSDDDERLMRELVASGNIPALSLLTGNGGFANARLNDAIGHAAFDYIESRWGVTSIRRFLNALIVPACGQNLQLCFRSDARGIRCGVPAIHGTPIQAGRSLSLGSGKPDRLSSFRPSPVATQTSPPAGQCRTR